MTCAADLYLHAARTLGWTPDTYADWVETTWLRMVDAAAKH